MTGDILDRRAAGRDARAPRPQRVPKGRFKAHGSGRFSLDHASKHGGPSEEEAASVDPMEDDEAMRGLRAEFRAFLRGGERTPSVDEVINFFERPPLAGPGAPPSLLRRPLFAKMLAEEIVAEALPDSRTVLAMTRGQWDKLDLLDISATSRESLLPALEHFVEDSPERQLAVLRGVQAVAMRAYGEGYPRGLLEKVFQELYDAEAIDPSIFFKWRHLLTRPQTALGLGQLARDVDPWLAWIHRNERRRAEAEREAEEAVQRFAREAKARRAPAVIPQTAAGPSAGPAPALGGEAGGPAGGEESPEAVAEAAAAAFEEPSPEELAEAVPPEPDEEAVAAAARVQQQGKELMATLGVEPPKPASAAAAPPPAVQEREAAEAGGPAEERAPAAGEAAAEPETEPKAFGAAIGAAAGLAVGTTADAASAAASAASKAASAVAHPLDTLKAAASPLVAGAEPSAAAPAEPGLQEGAAAEPRPEEATGAEAAAPPAEAEAAPAAEPAKEEKTEVGQPASEEPPAAGIGAALGAAGGSAVGALSAAASAAVHPVETIKAAGTAVQSGLTRVGLAKAPAGAEEEEAGATPSAEPATEPATEAEAVDPVEAA